MAKSFGLYAPDGSQYVTLTDGNNNVVTPQTVPYVPNNWYIPGGVTRMIGGSNPGANIISFFPGVITQQCTLNSLGVRIQTASGNLQLAIYAHNNATGKPTGTALASTTDIALAGATNGTINKQLNPGVYWFASNMDNATAVVVGVDSGASLAAQISGSSIQAEVITGVALLTGWTTPQTYGTWPDVTSAVWSKTYGGASLPLIQFRVGSVP